MPNTATGYPRNLQAFVGLLAMGMASSGFAASVSFSWDPVSGVDGYRLYYGTASGSYEGDFADQGVSPIELPNCTFDNANLPRVRLSGIDTGTFVSFAVSAYRGDQESDLSQAFFISVVPKPQLNLLPGGEGGLLLSWDAPPAHDSGHVEHYLVHYDIVSHAVGEAYAGTGALQGDSPIVVSPQQLADPSRPDFLLTGLDDGTTYHVLLGVHTFVGDCNPHWHEGCINSDEVSANPGSCSGNAQCDDGLFCNGAESCNQGRCLRGAPPCVADDMNLWCTRTCFEESRLCNRLDRDACLIDGSCYRDCLPNTANGCQRCAADSDPRHWQGCQALQVGCQVGVCNSELRVCEMSPAPDGYGCDDGDSCTGQDSCVQGECLGQYIDCSHLSGDCALGQCQQGTCVALPVRAGQACDDDNLCTSDTVCQQGLCQGQGVDCSHLDADCAVGICEPATGQCQSLAYEDGAFCNTTEHCVTGTCQSGSCVSSSGDCSALADACNSSACDDSSGQCLVTPANPGGGCDDGDPCTQSDSCDDGVCSGIPVDCSHLDSHCGLAVCEASTGQCQILAEHEGERCDDGDACTQGDSCVAGSCSGQMMDCTSFDAPCQRGVCDNGACSGQPADEGGICDTGLPCHAGLCLAGSCVDQGGCETLDSQCAVGVCNSGNQTCETQPSNQGQSCDDQEACTSQESCQDGVCGGGSWICDGGVPDAAVPDSGAGDHGSGDAGQATCEAKRWVPSEDSEVGQGSSCTATGKAVGLWPLIVPLLLGLRRRL